MMKMDQYETELLEALDREAVEKIGVDEERKKLLAEAAAEQLERMERRKQISLKIRESDLMIIKQKAKEVSIPYQNIIQALLHKYAKGEIRLEI
jgi:predicted DNA binding CopG/RHH family protein